MRLSGLASGFDTEEMVKQLMQVERMKVDKVEQNKQRVLWRQEEYNNVNKKFANFILNTQKDLGLKKSSSTGALFGNSYKNVDYIRRAISSNESTASVTTTSNAINGSYSFEVEQLAKGASFSSGEINDEIFKEKEGPITFQLSGVNKSEGDGNYEGEWVDIVVEPKKDQTTITMDDVAKAINSKSEETGITAFYDKDNGRLFMQTDKTGKGAEIDIKGDTNSKFLTDALKGTKDGVEGQKGIDYFSNAGQKSIIKYNEIQLKYDSNNINLNGLNIEIKAKGTTTINVNTNVDGMIEKIEKFVEDYNKLIDETAGLTNEKVYRDYHPLSPEERKALSEEDVKLWDEKAKSGLLNRDETLTRTLQAMRTSIYDNFEGDGKFKHITQIGISTEKYAMGSAGGKLEIDLKKLREAIEDDADGVMDLLFADGDEKESQGVITRVYDGLVNGMKSIIDKSGPGSDENLYRNIKSTILIDFRTKKGSISDLDKSINEMNRQIENLNILLDKKEESHYAKFTAMEKAMHKMNGQSDWLMQQFQY